MPALVKSRQEKSMFCCSLLTVCENKRNSLEVWLMSDASCCGHYTLGLLVSIQTPIVMTRHGRLAVAEGQINVLWQTRLCAVDEVKLTGQAVGMVENGRDV